jgi:hypothetical protein
LLLIEILDQEIKIEGIIARDPLKEVQAEEIDHDLVRRKRGEIARPLRTVMESDGFQEEKANHQTLTCAPLMGKFSRQSWVLDRI